MSNAKNANTYMYINYVNSLKLINNCITLIGVVNVYTISI